MNGNPAQRQFVGLLILTLSFSCMVCGQAAQSPNLPGNPQENSLQLPSLAIFGLPALGATTNLEKPINAKELEKFIAGIDKARAGKGVAKTTNYYWVIPMVFSRARNLFAKATWTKEEIKQGQEISDFFARIFAKPELKIDRTDPESFKNGLSALRNWFVSLCQDNKILGLMIYTTDDGPFFGETVAAERISGMRLLGSIQIPDQQASFVLLTDRSQPEPIIIGVINDDQSVRWLKRYSGAPAGRISSATVVERTISPVQGYGYGCRLMADWSYGFEPSTIYLDDSLNLRFYFISW